MVNHGQPLAPSPVDGFSLKGLVGSRPRHLLKQYPGWLKAEEKCSDSDSYEILRMSVDIRVFVDVHPTWKDLSPLAFLLTTSTHFSMTTSPVDLINQTASSKRGMHRNEGMHFWQKLQAWGGTLTHSQAPDWDQLRRQRKYAACECPSSCG